MGVFSDIELDWDGKVYTIRSNRVMKAIAIIEDHITLSELQAYSLKGGAPIAKLCMAYGAVLRYAGARVSDDAVYEAAFGGADTQQAMIAAINDLNQMMLPASARAKADAELSEEGGDDPDQPGEGDPGNAPAAASAS